MTAMLPARPGPLPGPQPVPARPAGECRITHIRYIGLAVADLDSGLGYYRDLWGLTPQTVDGDLAFLAAEGSSDPYTLRLRGAEDNRIDVVSFAVRTRGDVDWYAERLRRAGVRLLADPSDVDMPGGGYGFRFLDPVEGRTMEIAAGWVARQAREVAEGEHVPTGLSHVVLNTARLPEFVDFLSTHLGFFQADYLEDVMVFLKGDTPAHHMFAVSANAHANLNHVAYETRGLDEYMRAAGHMMRSGQEMVWGPGRHGPGSNTFAYFQDPNGFVAEYTTALENIEDVERWQPRVWQRVPAQSDQWGTACVRNPKPFIGVPDPGLWTPPPV
jgi:catechol 2,3-dioxygenase-like lactoylglutathione lyase family enzyme